MNDMESLVQRIASGGAKRIAVLGLTRGAGKATTLAHLLRGLQDRGIGVGIVAAGREEDDIEQALPARQIKLPLRAGTIVATTVSALPRATAKLETIEHTTIESSQGALLVVRVLEEGEAEPMGPGRASDLKELVEAVARHTHGVVLVEGSFNRRGISAPGVADGIIFCVGATMAPETERIVAGTRYYLDLFSLRAADERIAEIFPVAEAEGAAVLLDEQNTVVAGIPWRPRGNAETLLGSPYPPFVRMVVPRSVGDDFVLPLLREKVRFEIIVRDPMRIALSPVYYSAWQKLGGGIAVVHRNTIIALAVNPTNPSGPDKDAEEFLQAFRDGIPEVPSHDVLLEEAAAQPKKRWFGLGPLASR